MRYLTERFPKLIERELDKVEIQLPMNEAEGEALRNEVGRTLLGDRYDVFGIGNHELASKTAGKLGNEVVKWRRAINGRIIGKSK